MSLKISKTANNILKAIGWGTIIIILIVLTKVYFWEQNYYATKTEEPRNDAPAVITELASAISPSEEKPSAEIIEQYQTNADEPRYLSIKRLGYDKIIIEKTYVNAHVLQVPSNIYNAAWYSGSARPGKNGYTIITGLAFGNSGAAGIFANLDSLEKNDEIEITTGSNEKYSYQVRSVSLVDSQNAKDKLIDVQKTIEDKETLVLITNVLMEGKTKYGTIAIIQAVRK